MGFTPRRVELPITYEGDDYTLVFDMETVARYETTTGKSLVGVLQSWQPVAEIGADGAPTGAIKPGAVPMLTDLGQLLLAALQEHHPDLTRGHAMQMITDPDVMALFNQGIGSAMPQPGDAGEDTAPAAAGPTNRRARRAAQGSAGKTGSSSPPKRGSGSTNSGGQRRE